MIINVIEGDVLAHSADVLICPANCYLNMSGGVNGEILLRCGDAIQHELREFTRQAGVRCVAPATVVRTNPAGLPFQHILHAVAIDAFYGSSVELVAKTLESAFAQARDLKAQSVALPALATGYGPLSIAEFCQALGVASRRDWPPVRNAALVLRRSEDIAVALKILA